MLPVKIIPHLQKTTIQKLIKREKSARKLMRLQAVFWSYETNLYPNVKNIASKLCVTPVTIYNWLRAWNEKGLEGLEIKYTPKKPFLAPDDLKQFLEDVIRNPREIGYNFSSWTLKAMKMHLQERFHVTMTLSGIYYMLKRNNMTLLVPQRMPAKGDKKKS